MRRGFRLGIAGRLRGLIALGMPAVCLRGRGCRNGRAVAGIP